MEPYTNSSERPVIDLILFALGFIGFLITFWAIILTIPALLVVGGGILLFSIVCLGLRAPEI